MHDAAVALKKHTNAEPILFLKKNGGGVIQLTQKGNGKIVSVIPLSFTETYHYSLKEGEKLTFNYECKIIPDVQKGTDPETFPKIMPDMLQRTAKENIEYELFKHINSHYPTSNYKRFGDFEISIPYGNIHLFLHVSNIKAQ